MSYPLVQSHDGAKAQAQAVLAMVRCVFNDGIAESWDDEFREYLAKPLVSRWENHREQGYVIRMKDRGLGKQINIGFWEGRSSDNIDVLVYTSGVTTNAPTINDVPDSAWSDTGEVTKSFRYGQITEAAKFIHDALVDFWVVNKDNQTWFEEQAAAREAAALRAS